MREPVAAPIGTEEHWQIRKPAVEGGGGLVASHHYLASDIGAQVLAEGGNAVDAAIAASFAIGAVEPWMSGIGGGCYLLVYIAAEDRCYAVDGGMVAPLRLDPARYALSGGAASDLFAWPGVIEDRNLLGYDSIAVPGLVAALGAAAERFGSRPWAETLAPAIALAERGLLADWYATLKIATEAKGLAAFDESRRVYLPDGFPIVGEWGRPPPSLVLGKLAATLRALADEGPRCFYEGTIASALAEDLAAGGSALDREDLARYEARILTATTGHYRGSRVHAAPGLTAGPTLLHALELLEKGLAPDGSAPDATAYLAYADSLYESYAARLASMGDNDSAGEAAGQSSCTTHITVADKDGNLVALTQTLLSLFGSKVMLPRSGVLMNNGIMWFDPRPGRPNSIAAGKRPLSNMCPTVAVRAEGGTLALGASGGRRIMPAVFQLLSFLLDYGMSLDQAFEQGRIDVSGGERVTCDSALAPGIAEALASRHPVDLAQHTVYPSLYACPNAVTHDPVQGRQAGAAFVPSPWAKVTAA